MAFLLIRRMQFSERNLFPRHFSPLCTAALLLAGCSHPAAPAAAHKTIGDLAVSFLADPPPHVGDNSFRVTVAEFPAQTLVGNANITADPQMLSHNATGSKTSGRSQGNGVYLVPVRLGVATRYDIRLHIERPGHPPAEAAFPIEAAQ